MRKSFKSREDGFSFIELSVAVAIFSMGLGSLSLMMLAAIHGTVEAHHQTVATSQAESLAEMIAMSSDAYGHYVFPAVEASASCTGSDCNAATMAAAVTAEWLEQIRTDLPKGNGLVCLDSTPHDGDSGNPACDGAGGPVVKVFWEESRYRDTQNGGTRRVVTRIPW